jgi:enoyl-CoA hydratase
MPDLIIEPAKDILTITFNRPRLLNALTWDMLRELKSVLQAARTDGSVRVVVIAGAGVNFCSGADIGVEKGCSLSEYRQFVTDIQEITLALRDLDAIAIAAIQGYCLGGGMEIACACDLRIGAENARLGFPEVGIGLTVTSGASHLLPRLVGLARAKELMLTGDPLSAEEAERIGLVNRVVPGAELPRAVNALAEKIKSRSPLAVAAQKHLIDVGTESELTTILRQEVDAISTAFASHDGQEGMTAFLEKRAPRFTGD